MNRQKKYDVVRTDTRPCPIVLTVTARSGYQAVEKARKKLHLPVATPLHFMTSVQKQS
jgi:hypothetical protein